MTLSVALDVGIGLILMYLVLSLLVTATNELIAQFSSLRARHLQSALRRMLDLKLSETGTSDLRLFDAIRNSPTLAIAGAVSKTRFSTADAVPSYINRENFVAALREAIPTLKESASASASAGDVGALIQALPKSRVKEALKAALGDAAAAPQEAEKRLGDWFDGMMERATGAYKRWMSTFSLLIGIFLAVALNCDTLRVADGLAHSTALRAEIVKVAEDVTRRCTGSDGKPALNSADCSDARQNLDALQSLPIGWNADTTLGGLSIVGWLVTGFAVSLGAPFWFDLLSKIMNVRSSFKKERSGQQSAKTVTT